MNKKLTILLAVALITVTGVTAFSGSAIAQENATQTTNNEESSIMAFSEEDRTRILDYSFDGNTLSITMESEYARTVVISDMFVKGGGVSQVPRKRMTISKGVSEITFDVTEWNGNKGATIATSNGAIAVTSASGGGGNLPGGFSGETVVVFLSMGMLGGIGIVGIVMYKKQIDYTSESERIL